MGYVDMVIDSGAAFYDRVSECPARDRDVGSNLDIRGNAHTAQVRDANGRAVGLEFQTKSDVTD